MFVTSLVVCDGAPGACRRRVQRRGRAGLIGVAGRVFVGVDGMARTVGARADGIPAIREIRGESAHSWRSLGTEWCGAVAGPASTVRSVRCGPQDARLSQR